MVLRCHFFQFLLFSDYPIMSPNFWIIVWFSRISSSMLTMKKFWRKIISSRVFRGIPTSRPGFLEIEVIRVWWGTCYCHNCSVSQGRGRFSNLQFLPAVLVIFVPDFTQQTHCTWFWSCCIRILIQLLLNYSIFFLTAASFQLLNFSATSCVAFLMKTILPSSIRYTNIFFHVELISPLNIFQRL